MIDRQKESSGLQGDLADQSIKDLVGKNAISSMTEFLGTLKEIGLTLVKDLGPSLELTFNLLNGIATGVLWLSKSFKYLSPIVAGLAGYYWYLAAASATATTAMTGGLGALTIIAGLTAVGAAIHSSKSKAPRFATLPPNEFAAVQSGIAIADAGESIVHTEKLSQVGDTKRLETKMDDMVKAIKSLNLTTNIKQKDLNIVLTPTNA